MSALTILRGSFGKLNPSFSYDLEVLGRLVRAETIRAAISDPQKGLQIYHNRQFNPRVVDL